MPNPNYLRSSLLYPFKSWKNKYLKSALKKQAKASHLFDAAVREISEYTGESEEIVRQKHKDGPESERGYDIFINQQELSSGAVEEFYKKCGYYIYELPLWNAEQNRPRYLYRISRHYINRKGYKKVMDFGAGAGDLCIELARNNLDVTYCDIGGKLFDLARWRFARNGLSVKMEKGIDSVSETFDCIFSFDVFEHIHALPETIGKLASRIRNGGSLIFSGAFSGGTLHLEQNEAYKDFKTLDALMQRYGLSFQNKFAQFYFYKK